MWPFTNERKTALRLFAKPISPDVLDEILKHPENEYPVPRQMFIGYNLIQVRDDDVNRANDQIAKVMDVVVQNGGLICDKTLSLLLITFGVPVQSTSDPTEVCKSLALQMVDTFANDVKIIYGSGNTLVGCFGNAEHMHYGPMFPEFSQRLEMLCRMGYGSVREMNL